MRNRKLIRPVAVFLMVVMIAVIMPLNAFSAEVNTCTATENLTSESTVYLGKVSYDGVTVFDSIGE